MGSGSIDLVDVGTYNSMRRSHSCHSLAQFVTRNSKLSATMNDINSKSIDSPAARFSRKTGQEQSSPQINNEKIAIKANLNLKILDKVP